MLMAAQTAAVSKKALWTGRIISGWLVLFLLFDGVVKVIKLAPAMEGTGRLGYPLSLVVPIGIVELLCVIAYVIPRTSILGAILLTGYLGGATATQVRVEDPWFLFPVAVGVLLWVGLLLREPRLRSLVR
jgi:DoxX-like family